MAGESPKVEHISQPTSQPTRKVTAAGLAGAVSILLVAGLSAIGIELIPGVEAAMATVFTFTAAYVVKEDK